MCGIWGRLCTGEAPEALATYGRTVGQSLAHRGPDHSNAYLAPGIAMGIERLAIVDLEGGNQPIPSEDERYRIVYNGEVYNHRTLREELIGKGHRFRGRSDTETVLHAFEEFGPACLQRLDGMFAFAIWDGQEQRLFLARDRLGIKPLYIAGPDHDLRFASEAQAILAGIDGRPEPDWPALYRYLSFGYVPAPQSPFAGVRKLPAGHFAWADAEGLRIERYWEPELGRGAEVPPRAAATRLRELIATAVERELMSDVPLGVFLSGGLDSSAVALFASDCGRRPLDSFALRFEQQTHDESADARIVAEALNLRHHEVRFDDDALRATLPRVTARLDEPFGDSTVLPLLFLAEFARQRVKVVLTGWGGDEILAGYPTYRAHQLAMLYRRLPRALARELIPALVERLPVSDRYMSLEFKARRFLLGMDALPELQHFEWMGYFSDAQKQRLLRPAILEQASCDTLEPVEALVAELKESDRVSRAMHLDQRFFLEGNGLFQADRMTMAASLEARVPLLDRTLVEYCNALPAGTKMPLGRPKGLMRRALAEDLPARILRKPKKGFGPPSAAWIRGPLAESVDAALDRDRLEAQRVFVPGEVRRLLFEHRERRADHGRALWALLSFQLWYERFFGDA